jgi:hypothetical protein
MPLLHRLLGGAPLPPAARASLRLEQITELTVPVAFAVLEGGFIGVIADKLFHVPAWVLAVLTAAPMFGNLSSFAWNRLANARAKIPLIVVTQAATIACLLLIAAAPISDAGAVMLVVGVIMARIFMAGVVTMRSIVWSLNYDRAVRARTTGRLQILQSLVMVLATGVASPFLDAHPESFRWMYVIAMLVGTIGVAAFARVQVTGERRHRVRERRLREPASRASTGFVRILVEDRNYASYQVHQFLGGTANMMIEAPLIYLVSRELQASYTMSIAISMIIPFAISIVTLPGWARYLDRVHVTQFRARQSALWVVSQALLCAGGLAQSLAMLAFGRAVLGVARGGGSLAWSLGHNDFASQDRLAAYMGVHVTLTGIRGAFAPFLGVALYLGWQDIGWLPDFAGIGSWLFGVSAGLSCVSWWGFERLRRRMQPQV